MADENESASEGRPAGNETAGAAAAVALASASRAKADAFLDEQIAFVRLQKHEFAREEEWRHWSLRVRHASDVLKLTFELAVAFIVVVVAVGLAAAIWMAAHADGLVIKSFNVPASMSARGLNGDVIANKLLDRLTWLQTHTDSSRAASTFAHDWTNDIKVEIPDTGVSLGQVMRFLNSSLGHQTYLSGDLYETANGIALTVRSDGETGSNFEGGTGDLDKIVAQAAESVFAQTQPYRYAIYLAESGRHAESYRQAQQLASSGDRTERAWAYVGLAVIDSGRGHFAEAFAESADGRKENLQLPNFDSIDALNFERLSHEQAALRAWRGSAGLLNGAGAKYRNPSDIPAELHWAYASEAALQGDYRSALAGNVLSKGNGGELILLVQDFRFALGDHDMAAAREYLTRLEAMHASGSTAVGAMAHAADARVEIACETHQWGEAIIALDNSRKALAKVREATNDWIVLPEISGQAGNYEAEAEAGLGDIAKAEKIAASLPVDCDFCARTRGRLESLRRNWSGAAHWFKLVSDRSPSIPFADTDWGAMLLAKGDRYGAIVHFAEAHKRGPHFADPLELWGETLIAENRSDLALAKFAEAARYAPNWGRLHLKWGEALHWLGRDNDAKKQWDLAARLDLTPAERSQLSRLKADHG